jgi:hypothetical protein
MLFMAALLLVLGSCYLCGLVPGRKQTFSRLQIPSTMERVKYIKVFEALRANDKKTISTYLENSFTVLGRITNIKPLGCYKTEVTVKSQTGMTYRTINFPDLLMTQSLHNILREGKKTKGMFIVGEVKVNGNYQYVLIKYVAA